MQTEDMVTTSSTPRTERIDQMLAGLNDVQRRAATHRDGPVVVFAGAGSGKTRIITHRIAWLIEQGIKPWEILSVTFTNKAAGEMRERVNHLTPHGSRVLIATFHSACARWLREFAPELGFNADFTIYDDKDSLTAVKAVLAELNVKLDQEHSAQDYKGAIGRAKTMAMLPNDERLKTDYIDIFPPAGLQVYARYQELLAEHNAMDFGDLIMNMLLLLRRNDQVRQLMQNRYRYILVDEYQDTNRTQFELISHLAAAHHNLFVVGDDDQSIYSWRGAVPSNIIEFDQVYPEAIKITMEQNYRCSGSIVGAANAMIANNVRRVAKTLFTDNPNGDLINFRLETDNDLEAWYVVDAITSEAERFPLSDIAIFYRTNSQSRVMEDALRRENIPYRIFGTVRFYDRVEIKDLLAYLRVLVNPADNIALKRVINVPARGIGQKAVETIEAEATRRGKSMVATVEDMAAENFPRIGKKLAPFADLIKRLRHTLMTLPLDEVLEFLLAETQYTDYIEKKYPEQSIDKIENIHELGAALADYMTVHPDDSLSDWLQSITLTSSDEQSSSGVSLMTLHMAKGLEFKRVYILGVEEGLLPHRNSQDDAETLEEERRLFYVGMTRAKEKLSLLSAYRRRTFNQWSANRPSRFLLEIPNEYFEPVSEAERAAIAEQERENDYYSDVQYDYGDVEDTSAGQFEVGTTVSHPTYGQGVVEDVVDELGVMKASVRFDEFGLRRVMMKHLRGR